MGWIRIRMDPELLPWSGSGIWKIQSRIRNKSFRIRNIADSNPGFWMCATMQQNPGNVLSCLKIWLNFTLLLPRAGRLHWATCCGPGCTRWRISSWWRTTRTSSAGSATAGRPGIPPSHRAGRSSGESCCTNPLKWVCHKIFNLYFLWFESIWAPDQPAKLFSISPRYSITKLTSRCDADFLKIRISPRNRKRFRK